MTSGATISNMPRQKLENRHIRKIVRSGNGTSSVSIPIEFLRALKWRAKQKVVVEQRGKMLIIRDWEK